MVRFGTGGKRTKAVGTGTAGINEVKKPTQSKFFFDMLMSLDPNVVGLHILPHLPKLNTRAGVEWIVALYSVQCGDKSGAGAGAGQSPSLLPGAGLFGRNVLTDLIMPAVPCSPAAWGGITVEVTDYIKLLGGAWRKRGVAALGPPAKISDLTSLIIAVHGNRSGVGLGVGLRQCGDCMSPLEGFGGKFLCDFYCIFPGST